MLNKELLRRLQLPDLDDVYQYLRAISIPTLVKGGILGAITTYYLAMQPKPLPPPCDLLMQSVEVQGQEFVRRSILMKGEGLMTHFYDEAQTMYEFFLRGVRVSENGPCLGCRKPKQPYEWITYRQVMEQAENLGSAFLHKGHSKNTDPHIGIFSQNRPEWTVTELACYTFSLVPVPLFDTLGTEAISFIIDQAAISTIVCDVAAKADLVLDCLANHQHTVRLLVLMELPSSELVSRGYQAGIQILSMQEMEATGKANHRQPAPPLPEDMAVICFTSGSTGNPKGAMLTHRNLVCNSSAFISLIDSYTQASPEDMMMLYLPLAHMFERVVQESCRLTSSDVHISFLPLAHMFERVMQSVMLVHGGRIGFFQGTIQLLMDDLLVLKPTILPMVPRLLNRMYDNIHREANTSMRRWLLGFAYRRKEAELRKGILRRDSIWDKLLFRKVQDNLGGHIRLIITGSAPISPTVLTFLRAVIGCQFFEGYGQTECTGCCTMMIPRDFSAGHVGAPLPCNFVKLVDVAEMNYLATNGEGEVCIRGPNVFQGYLKDPEKTKEILDADGWLHTGDIGKWLPNGTLMIVDRKKNIFKLAQGEYIAPEKIECLYTQCKALSQVFVHGDSLEFCPVAVVVPHPDLLSGWVKMTLGLDGSYLELCARKEVKAGILEDMQRLGREGGLKSFEQVKAIHVHTTMFSVLNGLLTPTMKPRRVDLRKHFRSQIDELYAGINKYDKRKSVMLVHGGRIGFFQGTVQLLMDDLLVLKPTILPMVPRLLNRMYDNVGQSGKSCLSHYHGISSHLPDCTDILESRDRLPENNTESPENMVKDFPHTAPKLSTDTMKQITFHRVHRLGHPVGNRPHSIIAEFEPFKHKALVKSKGRQLKGTTLGMNDEFPREINDQGKNGTLMIVDRKKNIFKLAQGEYITPEKIE